MKLVRNNVPGLFPQHSYHKATTEEHGLYLKLKLAEEVGEVLSANNREDLVLELGDLRDVLDAYEEYIKLTLEEALTQVQKHDRLGDFSEGWILDKMTSYSEEI